MTEGNWDDFDDEAMDEMIRMFERMGMPVDVDVLRSLIKQVRNQFEQLGIDPKKVSMDEVKLGVDSDPEEFMKNFESMLSGPHGLGEFLKKMGVDIHIKPSVSEVRVDVDESHNSDEDNSISSDDVYIKENKMYVTIDVSRYEDIDRDNLEISLTGGGEVLQLLRKNQIRPFRNFVLPHASSGDFQWEINNGILDMKFELR